MCGGYRISLRGSELRVSYSPRVRGLSVVLSTVTRWLEVFPPCAGVIGRVVHGYPLAGSIPPACGGYRRYLTSSRKAQTYSPRMRGLSVTNGEKSSFVNVFPPHAGVIGTSVEIHCGVFSPHAGVIGENGNLHKNVFCIPPVCGGYRPRLIKAK